MCFIGIDPGKKGAIAFIDDRRTSQIVAYDECAYAKALLEHSRFPCFAILEKVHAMPGQGVTSMFSFGENFGFIRGLLQALSIPYQLVTPMTWMREFGIVKQYDEKGKRDKRLSIDCAHRLFPNAILKPTERCKVDNDGMAEALLIAEYGCRLYGRQHVNP